ncbi:hypothetical protein FSPOR_1602 [Fusarium sporotrichioides]|uniref:Uncharacterized protein n=1 Tax=Fusarium sporotrichioides TaxID=5514 RepID=A0A395SN83_FUSSP|nr:hypothetical protein FSPOR_1602 [Fusarium sporotrichioides]
MSQSEEPASPAWGSLPVECHLLNKWDSSLSLSVQEQRQAPVKAFVQENNISDFTSISGGAFAANKQDLIQTVLVPWRDGEVEKKYKTQGQIMRAVLPLVMAESE